jgi:hypothetical protein
MLNGEPTYGEVIMKPSYCTCGERGNERNLVGEQLVKVGGLMRTIALAMFAALALGMLGPFDGLLATATADEPRPPIAPLTWENVPLAIDSGVVQHDGTVAGVQSVFARVIESEGAAWVRLEFGDVELGNSVLGGNGATLRITSLRDGAVQYLDAVTIKQWSYTSAYFNGSAVLVELLAHPGTAPSRIQINSVQHGVHEASGHLGRQTGLAQRAATPRARGVGGRGVPSGQRGPQRRRAELGGRARRDQRLCAALPRHGRGAGARGR